MATFRVVLEQDLDHLPWIVPPTLLSTLSTFHRKRWKHTYHRSVHSPVRGVGNDLGALLTSTTMKWDWAGLIFRCRQLPRVSYSLERVPARPFGDTQTPKEFRLTGTGDEKQNVFTPRKYRRTLIGQDYRRLYILPNFEPCV